MAQRLVRSSVPEMDAIVGVEVPVLDDGFVRVVDYMGSDAAVVQAARVSFGAGTKRVQEDAALIRYLMRHRHTTPFEMCELKLHVRVPMDCWRQWIRHRTASVNEYSTRYSVAIDSAQRTPATGWRAQSGATRQGSSGEIDPVAGAQLSAEEEDLQRHARAVYEKRLAAGVAREQARKDLPLSTYTEAYWKIDLHNLLHFLELRLAPAAQAEIREYAKVVAGIVQKWCPVTYKAFVDYRVEAVRFSAVERGVLAALYRSREEASSEAERAGLIRRTEIGFSATREGDEFAAKLERLGLSVPWITS